MSLWLALVVLAGCAAALLAIPFLRPRSQNAQPATETDIYKQQLRQLNEEIVAGEVDAKVGAAERTAIERRILAEPTLLTEYASTPGVDRMTAIGVVTVVVLGAVALYAAIGQPSIPSAQPIETTEVASTIAPTTPAAQPQLPDVDTMISRLAARLKSNPNDAEGWRMLGWSYVQTQRYPQAVDAYAHAVALKSGSGEIQAGYGEALVLTAGGKVTVDALKAFNAALAALPNDPRAHYYLGLAKSQSGDAAGAISEWIAALKVAPPNSPWTPKLREEIEQQARTSGIDVSARLPPSPEMGTKNGPSPQDMRQAQALSPVEQQAMIKNMVEGLDQRLRQNPADPDGWVRLIRSRQVLGQPELARDALSRAISIFTNDKPTQEKIIAAAAGLGVTLDR